MYSEIKRNLSSRSELFIHTSGSLIADDRIFNLNEARLLNSQPLTFRDSIKLMKEKYFHDTGSITQIY